MTLSSVIVLANLMSDESRRLCKESKNMSKERLEYSILIKGSTLDALKELSWNELHSSKPSYDSIILTLIRFYKENHGRH